MCTVRLFRRWPMVLVGVLPLLTQPLDLMAETEGDHKIAELAVESLPSQKPLQRHALLDSLPYAEMKWIGERIYQNECASNPEYLIHWGEGENFPSLGIGHFIWYPPGRNERFNETFPDMVGYVSKFVPAPAWLVDLSPMKAPWSSAEALLAARNSADYRALQQWLLETQAYQAEFIVQQFNRRLQNYWTESALTQLESNEIKALIRQLLSFKEGRFALIDYVNFKGIGNANEQYQGEQWGVISVLQQIVRTQPDWQQLHQNRLLQRFIDSAKQRLALRVKLAPEHRQESRWLRGWFVRVDGYAKQ